MKSASDLSALRPSSFLSKLCAAGMLLLVAFTNVASAKVDQSTAGVPLYDQIVDRVRAKVAARLGNEPLKHDRYFIIPFAYENHDNEPEFSHSFMTVIRVFAHGKQSNRKGEFLTGKYKSWNFEAFNISWLPEDFVQNPNLCVFDGFGARLIATWNRCPVSPGRNFSLKDTLKLAVNAKVAVGMWGPYEISKGGFELGVKRKELLDSGKLKYRADDRLQRKKHVAINCFHAMAGLEELYPNGGLFGTGFKMWGLNGTSRVLIEYKDRGAKMGLLLEPVDVKKDRQGFVYSDPKGPRPYNPFESASAYRR